jgi:photosystem II stability/assembly factor-like uncharacterized protein
VSGVFRTTNGGSDWSPVSNGLTINEVRTLAVDPNTPTTVYAGTYAGVFKSLNSGDIWAPANNGLSGIPFTSSMIVRSMVINPLTSEIFIGTDANIYRSSDGAGSWTPISQYMAVMQAMVIDPTNPDIMYAGYIGGEVWKTSDGGDTWARILDPHSGLAGAVNAIVLDPSTPSTLYVGNSSDAPVYKSIDGGDTWKVASSGFPTSTETSFPWVYSLAIDPADPAHLYAGTYSVGVFQSMDGGDTWTPFNSGLPTHSVIWALAITPGEEARAAAAASKVYAGTQGSGAFSLELVDMYLMYLPGIARGH